MEDIKIQFAKEFNESVRDLLVEFVDKSEGVEELTPKFVSASTADILMSYAYASLRSSIEKPAISKLAFIKLALDTIANLEEAVESDDNNVSETEE